MRGGGASAILLPLLALAAACSSRVAVRPAPWSAWGAASAGSSATDPAVLQQQLAERNREIMQLQAEVQEARARENDMRASLERASRALGGGAAGSPQQDANGAAAPAPASGTAAHPDVVLAALRAALSQEQERREIAESQLSRLKEETSASYAGPRVPESDYLAVKQELVVLRQALDDEQATCGRQPAAPPTAAVAAHAAASTESPDARVQLQHMQEERDAIVETLTANLNASQKRVTDLEQQLGSTGATTAGATTAGAAAVSAENARLRAQLEEEHRRTEALTAKLKVAERVNDLIFKIQAQQAEARPRRREQ